jgi:Protein of unknown function (DUF2909)
MDGVKVLIVIALFGIVVSLGKAMFHLSSARTNSVAQSAQMARALTVRIGLSVALFVLLMVGWYFGGITPHGVN